MNSRFLLVAALLASLASAVDPAFARPRRKAALPTEPVRTVAESKPVMTEPIKQVIYPVADLIVPIQSRANLDVDPLPGPRTATVKAVETIDMHALPTKASGAAITPTKLMPGQTTEHLLIELIKNTVAANSWLDKGGHGTIQYYPLGMSLVVNQTLAVHEEVSALLAAVRRLYDIEAAVEMRVVTASPAAFDKACKEMDLERVAERDNPAPEGKRTIAPKGKRWTAFLDTKQSAKLLALLQEDRATNIMQAPKITAFNGQNVALNCTEDRFLLTSLEVAVDKSSEEAFFVPTQSPWVTGSSFGMQSVVSADRRHVHVQMKGYWSQFAGPVQLQPVQMPIKSKNEQGKVETTTFQMFLQMPTFAQVKLDESLTIPDGGTALISCGVVPIEVQRSDLVAKLSRFCGGEAKTTSAERHVFFMITPRVIINEEQEIPVAGQTTPIPRP